MNISELAKFRGGVSVDTINELTSASGVTADGVLLKDAAVTATGGVTTPTISEAVSGSGVTVDGVLLKDSNVNASGVTAETVTATGNMVTDTILERTSAAGVTIDGVLLKDGGITATGTNTINLTTITADTINETTAGSGVTVDGVLIKDSGIANTFITNDGSADSPRGWAISTNADYTFTATGPSRARCTATSANRSVNLPTTGIKAGYEAEVVTACTSPYTITVKSSDGDTVDTMIGTKGRIRCVALQDAPTDGTHWEFVQVEDAGTWTPVIAAQTGSITSYSSSGTFYRSGRQILCNFSFTITNNGTGASNGSLSGLPFTCNANGASAVCRSSGAGGHTIVVPIAANDTTGQFWKYDNTYPFATNSACTVSLAYQI